MKTIIKNQRLYWLLSASIVVMIYISSCKQEKYPIGTNSTLNAIQYFENNADFSLFDQALEKTGYAGFLGAYGTYTVFAPTNNAINTYLKTINKTSLDQLDAAALKTFVSFHIIQDTLSTLNFTDGKLPTPTMYGQYITTGAANTGGVSNYIVNKQATVLKPNIRVGNGIIHTLDHVLLPATLTIAQIIAQNPKYSIFNQALTATGFYDTLNVAPVTGAKRPFLTLIAQTDSVFNAAGISSYTDLKNRYSTTGNPKNPGDSLYLYVAYRIIPSLQFLGDIIGSPSQTTLAPQENIATNLINNNVVLNQVVFNGVTEIGVQLSRPNGDVPASNGVVQTVLTNFKYKVRQPAPVYYDVCDQPELRKVTSVFRRVGTFLNITQGQVAAYNWEVPSGSTYVGPQYSSDGGLGSKNMPVYNDWLYINLRVNTTSSWIEFTTPLIVKGSYKVWICRRVTVVGTGHGQYTQVSVDGQPLSRIVNFTSDFSSATASAAVLESQGYKRYLADPIPSYHVWIAELAGVVNIASTDVHKIRFTSIKDAGKNTNGAYLDMIQFIPTNLAQTDKCITTSGQVVPTPTTFP